MLSQGGNDERVSMMVPSERARLRIACGVGNCERVSAVMVARSLPPPLEVPESGFAVLAIATIREQMFLAE